MKAGRLQNKKLPLSIKHFLFQRMCYLAETSMSLNVPSKVEVMGWNPQSLADYMRSLKLSGCNKLVLKGSISGAQFMKMTVCDLQVFPSLYVPIITKIQSEINKGEEKRVFGSKSKAQMYPKQAFVQKEEVSDSDEFDSESDEDYEFGPEKGDDGYICALAEPQTAEQEENEEIYEENYKRPSSADVPTPCRHPGVAKQEDSLCKDPIYEESPVEKPSKPLPPPPTMSHSPQRPFKAPEGSTVKATGLSTSKITKPRVPTTTDVSNRAGKTLQVPPAPRQVKTSLPGKSQGLDPSWYGGKVTRHQAEIALREVNKDGAFVVRDSSHGMLEHPYTLMLLKQGRVYNIMIRNQGNSYSLGNGLKNTQSFPGVKEMITHHTNTPLLLKDAPDQSSEAPNPCCLLHPAGL